MVDIGTLGVNFIIGLIGAAAGATVSFATLRWQKSKENTEIKRKILADYQISFKDFVILIEGFVVRLVLANMKFSSIQDDGDLSDYLPYGYQDRDTTIDMQWMNKYPYFCDIKDIRDIRKVKNAYLDFPENGKPLKETFSDDYEQFRRNFSKKREEVARFMSALRLYYKEAHTVEEKFDQLWLIVMVNHMTILKMIEETTSDGFKKRLNDYNDYAKILFQEMREFEIMLGEKKPKVK